MGRVRLPQSIPPRFVPSKETLAVLNGRVWVCSYSGGKDSTALVTWVEWLRRVGMVKCETPRLVMSDTTVEYPFLRSIAERLMSALRDSGWHCEVVTPLVKERLYCRIFGIGNTPVHPGNRGAMRWCTRSTKIDPMLRFSRSLGPDTIQLTGVRWGESEGRDRKLSSGGCAAGGECGLPQPGDRTYGPVIDWTLCKVVDWLNGLAGEAVSEAIGDLLPVMGELVKAYGVRPGPAELFGGNAAVSAMRFGCIGCPAITNEKVTRSAAGRANPAWAHLRKIYAIWDALYARKNRCVRVKPDGKLGCGPVRLEVRKRYFKELLSIQKASGVTLVTDEDVKFIRSCWRKKVYPRGWSAADELTEIPNEGLFKNLK
jgi:DNA sulfur modification protein DndC